MKNTSLAILIAFVGVMGIRTAAFAQQVPVSAPMSHVTAIHASVAATLRQTLALPASAAVVAIPVHTPVVGPSAHVVTPITAIINPAVLQAPITPIVNTSPVHDITIPTIVDPAAIIAHPGLQSINPQDITAPNAANQIPNPDPSTPAPVTPPPPAPVITPAPAIGNGNQSFYGTTSGSIVQTPSIAPVTQPAEAPAAPAYVAPTFHVTAKPVYVYQKLSLTPQESSVMPTLDNSNQSALGASTYTLGMHISLIEVLLALAALLALMVGAKEYQNRKRIAQAQTQSHGHIMYA